MIQPPDPSISPNLPPGSQPFSPPPLYGSISPARNPSLRLVFDPRRILHYWRTLLLVMLLALVAALGYLWTAEKIYEASGHIELSVRRPRIMAQQAAIIEDSSSAQQSQEIFNTRLERFKGRTLLLQALERLDTERPGAFAPPKSPVNPSADSAERQLASRLAAFEKALQLTLVRRSRLIRVSFSHSDPELAAAACTAFMLTSESSTIAENRGISDAAVVWLESQASLQREELLKVENALLQFRREFSIDPLESQRRMVDEALQNVNRTLIELESRESTANVLASQIEALPLDPERAGSIPTDIPRADEIRSALEQWRSAVLERQSLLATYTPNHPEIKTRDNAIALYRQQAQQSLERARATARANQSLLRGQVESLRSNKDEHIQLAATLEIKIVELRTRLGALEREREAADQTFRSILARIQDARMAADETTAIVKIVEAAVVPFRPVHPNPLRTLALAGFLGGLLALLVIFISDNLEDRVSGPMDFEPQGIPVLAVIPHVDTKDRSRIATASIREVHSEIGEAFAGLGTVLDSPRHKPCSQVILIASSIPGEGKTVTSCNLSATLAQKGRRVLLIDFDLRRPRLADIFPLPETHPDLFSALSGGCTDFDTLPYPAADCPQLDIIASRPNFNFRPAATVGQSLVGDLILWARQHYDHIVLDAPPLGLVSDILALAPLADITMVMARPVVSRKRLVWHSLQRLMDSGIQPAGLIVNDFDVSKMLYKAYSPYYHYRQHYQSYATPDPAAAKAGPRTHT